MKSLFLGTAHTVAKNVLTNWVSSLVNRNVGMQYRMSQKSMNRFATCAAVFFNVGAVRVRLK